MNQKELNQRAFDGIRQIFGLPEMKAPSLAPSKNEYRYQLERNGKVERRLTYIQLKNLLKEHAIELDAKEIYYKGLHLPDGNAIRDCWPEEGYSFKEFEADEE